MTKYILAATQAVQPAGVSPGAGISTYVAQSNAGMDMKSGGRRFNGATNTITSPSDNFSPTASYARKIIGIISFQINTQKNGRAYLGNARTEDTHSMVEVPAVAPTMAGPNYSRGGGRTGHPRRKLGPIFLPTPVGYQVG